MCSTPKYYHIERFMEGEYRKYNSNSGFVDEQLRNTPQVGFILTVYVLIF